MALTIFCTSPAHTVSLITAGMSATWSGFHVVDIMNVEASGA